MSLSQRLGEYITAAFTGIWIQSHEHSDALVEIARLCKERSWSLAVWDIEQGLQTGGQATAGSSDPLAAIRSISSLARPDSSALLVLPNFHRFLQSAEIVQALIRQIQAGKQNRTFIVILSPVLQIPVELEKQFIVIDHDLPDRSQLQAIAQGIATEPGEMPREQELDRLIDAAAGLTRFEAEVAGADGAGAGSVVSGGWMESERPLGVIGGQPPSPASGELISGALAVGLRAGWAISWTCRFSLACPRARCGGGVQAVTGRQMRPRSAGARSEDAWA